MGGKKPFFPKEKKSHHSFKEELGFKGRRKQ